MHFLEIPGETIDAGVLPHLAWNDLLRLRRVCSWTKGITDGYLQVNPQLAPEIEINQGTEKTLKAFLLMNIPTTKLFLNNQYAYSFYEKIDEETQHQFLEKLGPLVKHLRVTELSFLPFERELELINGMKNMKSFEAGYIGSGMKTNEKLSDAALATLKQVVADEKDNVVKYHHLLPPVFKALESIKIGQDDEFVKTVDIVTFSRNTFMACPQLKYACHPFDSTTVILPDEHRERLTEMSIMYEALPRALGNLFLYVDKRPNLLYPSDVNGRLEVYDFQNYHNDNVPWTMESSVESHTKLRGVWVGSKFFLQVCARALKTGLKLMNVNPSWYCARFLMRRTSPELGIPVVSLVGLDPCVMQLDMPNLEKITIPSTSGSIPGDEMGRPLWPALKCVDVTVDGKVGYVWDMDRKARFGDITQARAERTSDLYKLLFGNGVVFANMAELDIRFVEGKSKNEVAVPKVEEIVASCPNLKRIKLGNWMGTNKQLVTLWEGLSGLEEISLENCKELGNVAFVGEDAGNPVFLGLKDLKKLSLKGLDKMPKISDTLFILVLSKMQLRELVLTSEEPVKKVTKNSLNSLLAGPFAETIERFPFRDWSMADITPEEFQEMGKKFRSYDMI